MDIVYVRFESYRLEDEWIHESDLQKYETVSISARKLPLHGRIRFGDYYCKLRPKITN